MRARDALRLFELGSHFRLETLVLKCEARCASNGADQLLVVEQTRPMGEIRHLAASLDERRNRAFELEMVAGGVDDVPVFERIAELE